MGRNERFGIYLAVDIGEPRGGRCSWDCVYCPQRSNRARKGGWRCAEAILSDTLARIRGTKEDLDTLLIVAAADPSLHPRFPAIVQGLREIRKRSRQPFRIGCMVNGSTLASAAKKTALGGLDHLCVKLDCGEEDLFARVNRPAARGSGRRGGALADTVDKLRGVREFHAHTTLWRCPAKPELQNWRTSNLEALYRLYGQLTPKSLYLTTTSRRDDGLEILPVGDADLTVFAMRVEELGIPVRVSHSYPGGEMIG